MPSWWFAARRERPGPVGQTFAETADSMKRNLTYGALLTGVCLALAAMTLLAGCGSVAGALNIVDPKFSIRDIRPRLDIALPLSQSSIDFDFTIGVDNPNRVGLRLDEIDFSLFANGQRLIDSVSNQRISIPANGYSDVRLTARVGYNQIRNLWGEISNAIQGNRARYEVRGNAWFNTPVGRMRFPVTVYSTGRDGDRDNRR